MPDPGSPPSRIGPYLIERRLGRGGMGVVYLACHATSGEMVALKTVRVPKAALVAGIRQEIDVLARLDHPGIVRIHDHGLVDGIPWYAMDLLRGATLRRHIDDLWADPAGAGAQTTVVEPAAEPPTGGASADAEPWWTASLQGPTAPWQRPASAPHLVAADPPDAAGDRMAPAAAGSLQECLILVRRLCGPLSYLHGEGVVHRDLKPENVLLRPGLEPVLLDFGLTAELGDASARERVDRTGSLGGTLAYMAPEQALGQRADARSDLYALGCILYEMLAGRPPFIATVPQALLWMHVETAPEPPSHHVTGLAPEIDALVLALLEKDPGRRLAYADSLAYRLVDVGAVREESDSPATPRPYLYRPPLTGRGVELELLQSRVRDLRDGRGSVVSISGEAGIGKTRLAMEACYEAARLGIPVHAGTCAAPEGVSDAAPLQGLRPVLTAVVDRCRELGAAEVERLLGPRASLLMRLHPELGSLPGSDGWPEPDRAPSAALIIGCLIETLHALCATDPRVVIVDDLQWADPLTLGLLARVAAAHHLPALVVTCHRPEDTESTPLAGATHVARLSLARLPSASVEEMVRAMLTHDAPPAISNGLAAHSEGNPLIVAAYLQEAIDLDLLTRSRAGQWTLAGTEAAAAGAIEGLRLPGSIAELAERRLSRLTDEERELARLAAVTGPTFGVSHLALAVGAPEDRIVSTLNDLTRARVVEANEQGGHRFSHRMLRGRLLTEIPPERRRALHRLVAGALEKLPAATPIETRASLAMHWREAGDALKARGHFAAAGELAARAGAMEDAARLYGEAVALTGDDDASTLPIRHALGVALLSLARHADALRAHRIELRLARRARLPSRVALGLRSLGKVFHLRGRTGRALRLFELGLGAIADVDDDATRSILLGSVADVEAERGNVDTARKRYGQVIALARAMNDPKLEGTSLTNLASLAYDEGRLDESRQMCEQALALFERAGSSGDRALVLNNLGSIHDQCGRRDEARRCFDEALAIGRASTDVRSRCHLLANLAAFQIGDGDTAGAERLLDEALASARRLGEPRLEGYLEGEMGRLLEGTGRMAEAEAHFETARTRAAEIGERRLEGTALRDLARLLAARGEHGGAQGLLQRASELAPE